MSNLKGRGIVLREYHTGETDKVITLLLKEHGKMRVFSKGARNTKSKFLTGTQLFAYSDFLIYDKQGVLATSQIDLIENFYNIRNDYDKLCFASYYIEVADKFILEGIVADDILYLILKTLSLMTKNKLDDSIVYIIFNYKFLQLNGFSPLTGSCTKCGEDLTTAPNFFLDEGFLCFACGKGIGFEVSKTSVYTINHILNSSLDNLFNFRISDEIIIELVKILHAFFDYHFDMKLNTRQFIDIK